MIWLLLLGMAVITFYNRFLFLIRGIPIELGPKSRRLLEYSMYAVLTAIWVPIIFAVNEKGLPVANSIALLVGAVVAAVLTVARVPSIVVVLASSGVFFILHLFF